MKMYDDLIKKVDARSTFVIGCNECNHGEADCTQTHQINHLGRKNKEALLNVLNMHKPYAFMMGEFHNCEFCKISYPCPTVEVIWEVMKDVNPHLSSSTHS